MSAGGLKYDEAKLRWDLLPMNALEEVAKVYSFGANKYESWNWRKGLSFSRCFAALMRHLYAWWWKGETVDPESGCHHLASVAFYVLNFLCYEQDGRKDLDDRPRPFTQPKYEKITHPPTITNIPAWRYAVPAEDLGGPCESEDAFSHL